MQGGEVPTDAAGQHRSTSCRRPPARETRSAVAASQIDRWAGEARSSPNSCGGSGPGRIRPSPATRSRRRHSQCTRHAPDVGMIQRGEDLGFPLETGQPVKVSRKRCGQGLESNIAAVQRGPSSRLTRSAATDHKRLERRRWRTSPSRLRRVRHRQTVCPSS